MHAFALTQIRRCVWKFLSQRNSMASSQWWT